MPLSSCNDHCDSRSVLHAAKPILLCRQLLSGQTTASCTGPSAIDEVHIMPLNSCSDHCCSLLVLCMKATPLCSAGNLSKDRRGLIALLLPVCKCDIVSFGSCNDHCYSFIFLYVCMSQKHPSNEWNEEGRLICVLRGGAMCAKVKSYQKAALLLHCIRQHVKMVSA